MKTKGFWRRYAGILLLLAAIVVLLVLMIGSFVTPESFSTFMRVVAFLPLLIVALWVGMGEKKVLSVLPCILLAAAGAVISKVLLITGTLKGILGEEAFLVIPGLDTDERHLSVIIIGIVGAVCLMVYTLYSIGSQKKNRKMKRRPTDQMLISLLSAILLIIICIELSRFQGIPLALIIAAVICILLFALKRKLSGLACYVVAGVASFISGVLLAVGIF